MYQCIYNLESQIEEMKMESEMIADKVRLKEKEMNRKALEMEARNKDLDAQLTELQMQYLSQAERHNDIRYQLKSEMDAMRNALAQNEQEILQYKKKINRLLDEIEEENRKGIEAKEGVIDNLEQQLNEVQGELALKEQEQLDLQEQHRKELEQMTLQLKAEREKTETLRLELEHWQQQAVNAQKRVDELVKKKKDRIEADASKFYIVRNKGDQP